MTLAPKHALNNGVEIDVLGYGVFKVPADDCADLVSTALDVGYRSVDTAAIYENEAGVGQAVRQAVASGTPREELFVTSKVWNDRQGFDSTLRAFDETMERLGLDYLDMYLIHWPCPERNLYVESYKALERLYDQGRVRAIGVSNFEAEHLRRLLDSCEVVPALNQIELHPWLQQKELRELNASLGIATQSWSPLARGQLFEDPLLGRLAARKGKSIAQIALRWQVQSGLLVIPKASSEHRMAGNLDVFDFALSEDEMADIASLDRGQRTGSNPKNVN